MAWSILLHLFTTSSPTFKGKKLLKMVVKGRTDNRVTAAQQFTTPQQA